MINIVKNDFSFALHCIALHYMTISVDRLPPLIAGKTTLRYIFFLPIRSVMAGLGSSISNLTSIIQQSLFDYGNSPVSVSLSKDAQANLDQIPSIVSRNYTFH